MKDELKTKVQLIQELNELRKKISQFNTEFVLPHPGSAPTFSGKPGAKNNLKSLNESIPEKPDKRKQTNNPASPKKSNFTANPEAKNSEITPLSPDLILVTDFTGEIEFISLNASRLLGADSPDSLPGQSLFNLIAPKFRKSAIKIFEKIKKTEISKSFNLPLVRSDGSTFKGEFNSVIENNRIILTLQDVDWQQAPQKDPQGKGNQFQYLLNTIPLPTLATNEDLLILHFNDAFARLLEKPPETLEGQDLMKVFPEFQDTPFYAASLDTLSTSLTHEIQEWYHSRLFHARIFRTADGLLLIFEDLTRQRQSEIHLLQSEARFRLIAENIHEGILLFEDDLLTYINKRAAEILGYPHHELLNLLNQVPEAAPELRVLQPYFQNTVNTLHEVWFSRNDSSRRCLLIRTTAQPKKSGKNRCYVVLSDITRQKQAEEALRSRSQILTAISEAALVLLQSTDFVKAIQKSIKILGKATRVSRVFLSQSPENFHTHISRHRFDWHAGKANSVNDAPGYDVSDVNRCNWKYWKKDLSAGKPILAPLVPPNSTSLSIKKLRHIVVIPIFIVQKLWGYLGFVDDSSQRKWNQVEIDALQSAGSVIGSTLLRYHSESLQQMQKLLGLKLGTTSKLKDAFQHLLASIVQIDCIDCGAIFQADPGTEIFKLLEQKNLPPHFMKQVSSFRLSAPDLKRINAGKPFFLNEKKAASFPRILPKDKSFKAIALIPIRIHRKVHAALYLASQTFGEISPETANILETLGTQMSGIITRIQTQEALAASQENLQTLFNSIDDFLLIFNFEGRVLHFNLAIQARLGYTHEALLQLNFDRIFVNTPATEIAQLLGRLRQERTVLCQFTLLTKDGVEIPVETKISKSDWNGTSVYFGISRDISERKHTEAHLQFLSSITEQIEDFIIVTNNYFKIIYVNKAAERGLGYRRAELLEKQLGIICPTQEEDTLRPRIHSQINEGHIWTGEVPIKRSDGTIFYCEMKFSPIYNPDQQITSFVAILRDISERKTVELELETYRQHLEQLVEKRTEELQIANSDLKSFACTVSHDLRAPLRAMSGFSQILQENYADKLDSDGKMYLQRISEASQRMDTLLLDLMAYSRLTQTQIQCHLVDLNQVINEILEQLQPEILEKNARITVTSSLPVVYGHPMLIEQILTNLIQNGLKFVPPERTPEIHIWAEKKSAFVRIWISDNGVGIEEKYFTQIFNPFERLHSRNAFPGTGIGLAIVRKGVERMGGHTGLESVPGVGSKFWIELKENPPEK